MSRDDATLLDALKAARLAASFVEGMDQPAFAKDLKPKLEMIVPKT